MSKQAPAVIAALLLTATIRAAEPAPSLEWLGGHWCMQTDDQIVEELWLPPHGGVALGVGRSRTPDRTTAFEYFRIVGIGGAARYIAQPGGRPPVTFVRTDGGARWIRFENPQHDFPQRIEYRRDGEALLAEIAGPGADGEEVMIASHYRRCTGSDLSNPLF